MLQLTQPAARMLDQVRRDQQIPGDYGVRVSGRSQAGGDLALQITFANVPVPHDTVDVQYGTKLFVAEEVVEPLSDVAMDVTANVAGNGASPKRLVLRPQPRDQERRSGDQ